jgi:hypothetical protein
MKKCSSLFLAFAVAGCATTQPTHVMSVSYNPEEVAWFNTPGTNSITANALMRTVGGEVKTCAGFEAALIPYSAYAAERITAIYGNANGGYASYGPQFSETDPRYSQNERKTTCDSQGNFRFTNLPDGDYYVRTQVTWGVPMGYYMTSQQGGALAQRVSVRGGETKSIVLTN